MITWPVTRDVKFSIPSILFISVVKRGIPFLKNGPALKYP